MGAAGREADKPRLAQKRLLGLLLDLVVLSKPRITLMVLVATLVGYMLGAGPERDWAFLLRVLAATFLVGAGINALNQYMEIEIDGLMARTSNRPLPAGRMHPRTALGAGACAGAAGVVLLWVWANALSAAIAMVVVVTYLLCYTPLKRVSGLNTLVGAVPGALPPVLGWAAARNALGPEPLALFLIMFIWQPPHFLSIAHLYKDQYARAGLPMLTVTDTGGGATRRQLIIYSATLIPISMYPSLVGLAGEIYFFGALALSLLFLAAAAGMAISFDDRSARRLLRASVFYLPLLFGLLLYDSPLL